MGDMSKEPSMEEILSSIKRIIAEDAENADPQGGRKARYRRESDRESHRKAVVASMAGVTEDVSPSYVDEVLELTDEMPKVGKGGEIDPMEDDPEIEPVHQEQATTRALKTPVSLDAAAEGPIVSVESEIAARSSLAALSSMIVSPSTPGDHTLEGLVREMLKPMLKQWLDANLPTLVEGMVAKEIARITGRSL